jgi:SAM-dependent methyltransferase/mannose-6-phosphate isomerase-like protein (cupin superfamily)
MTYVHTPPTSTSFTGKGLLGYTFGPLNNKRLEVYYIQVHKGHDVFMISRKITRLYYVISGTGYFTIAGRRYDVGPGCVVEAPPRVEYCYSGAMTLIGVSTPRWFSGNDLFTRWNPDVVRGVSGPLADGGWLTRLLRVRLLGKSPANAYLQLHKRLWSILPFFVEVTTPVRLYAAFLNKVARMHQVKGQALSTLFLRNRPMLELIRRLVARKGKGEALKVAVLGSSTGAEVYSVAWTIRSARPDLRLNLSAVDISQEAVAFGRRGVYSTTVPQLTNTKIFELMSRAEVDEMFDKSEEAMTVKPWIKEGIDWHVGDAGESEVLDLLGPQDFVIANNFLCHMDSLEAERCLRNIARLVKPGGYLCVAGIDLDTRTRVAINLGWTPVQELLEEIHEGDPYMRAEWPCHYAGLEPLNKSRGDWKRRYATVFQLNTLASAEGSIASILIKDEALA